MEKLVWHIFKYCEVYMLGSAFAIAAVLLGLLFYELKKHPHLVLELKDEEPTKE